MYTFLYILAQVKIHLKLTLFTEDTSKNLPPTWGQTQGLHLQFSPQGHKDWSGLKYTGLPPILILSSSTFKTLTKFSDPEISMTGPDDGGHDVIDNFEFLCNSMKILILI